MIVYGSNNHLYGTTGYCFGKVSPTPVVTLYSGWTYECSGPVGLTMDPAIGTPKNLSVTYIQISGGNWSGVYTQNPAGLSDCLGIYAPSAGTYSMIWNNWDSYSGITSFVFQAPSTAGNITKILSMDFYNKVNAGSLYRIFRSEPITDLPNKADDIHNGAFVTSCRGLFEDTTTITGEVIPFITSMNAACPNLSETRYCLSNATGASDYALAVQQYPSWF